MKALCRCGDKYIYLENRLVQWTHQPLSEDSGWRRASEWQPLTTFITSAGEGAWGYATLHCVKSCRENIAFWPQGTPADP